MSPTALSDCSEARVDYSLQCAIKAIPHHYIQLKKLRCTVMRGGTSKAVVILLSDLLALYPSSSGTITSLSHPHIPSILDHVLPQVMGTGDQLQIDGLGGGNPLTSKAAIVCPSTDSHVDVEYLFAQVSVLAEGGGKLVDLGANCGNVLAAVGVFAVENGLLRGKPEEPIVVHNVNTKSLSVLDIKPPSLLSVQTALKWCSPLEYPVALSFPEVRGAKSGLLFPTGDRSEIIHGKTVSLIDAATPVLFLLASEWDFHPVSGWDDPVNHSAFQEHRTMIEVIRREMGISLGLGDVSQSVLPKVCVVSDSGDDVNDVRVLYLTPHAPHASIAVTGALCLAVAASMPETVPYIASKRRGSPLFRIGHSKGTLEVVVFCNEASEVVGGSLVRTARTLIEGNVPVWMKG